MGEVALFDRPLLYQLTTLFGFVVARALILAGGSSLWIRFSAWAQRHRIVAKGMDCSTLSSGLLTALLVLALDVALGITLLHTGVFQFVTDFTWGAFLLTFAAMFVWVEIYFYYSHRLLHHPKLFWLHRQHHQQMPLNPWTSLSFSVGERVIVLFGAVVVPALITQFVAVPAVAILGYFFLNYVLNVFGHLNVEVIPNRWVRSFWGRWLLTPTYHGLHHIRYRGHYGLFTPFLDKLHGSYFEDYPEFHQQKYEGK